MALKSSFEPVANGVDRLRYLFVNLYFVGTADNWVMVDAGLQGSAREIRDQAEQRFGEGATPKAFILTHGHFDHVGAFPELFEHWDVPIYAHPLEMPYLTGEMDYPEPDPTVGKGAMALLSFAYPNAARDFGDRVKPLPTDGSVPFMDGWRWIFVPGHTNGQVALYREDDGVLLAADAFVTTKQESLYEVMTQKEGVHGPPAYFTTDWVTARQSVEKLAELNPRIAATGHGTPMEGEELRAGLADLLTHFDEIAVPDQGKYVPGNGTDER